MYIFPDGQIFTMFKAGTTSVVVRFDPPPLLAFVTVPLRQFDIN